jgi:hypothetical protein
MPSSTSGADGKKPGFATLLLMVGAAIGMFLF